MRISLIVAASANNVIGLDGKLPWHLPDDFAYFKATTMGKPIVMGRATWDSIGRALPGRLNIVITRQADFLAPGASVAASPGQAVRLAGPADELMVIGGGQVYAAFLPLASRIYLTRVAIEIDGDTYFTELDPDAWALVGRETHAADDRHAFPFEFRVYDRL
jgi:dihydrofolate reductase